MSDQTEQVFRDALRERAAQAPRTGDLARTARARVARRRAGVAGVVVAALAVVGGALLVGGPDGSVPRPLATQRAPSEVDETLPDGWRWESYGGIEVGVPGDWEAANGTQRISQWCVGPRPAPDGFVGRPGITTLVGCPERPGPSLEVVGPYVDFTALVNGPDQPVRVEGDVARQTINSVVLNVQAPEPLRGRILATVRAGRVDANGCATTDPISKHPSQAPDPPADVTALSGVRSVTACRYALDGPDAPSVPRRLLSSLRLTGDTARDVVSAIAAGAVGGGPNRPDTCTAGSRGDEALVLLVQSDAGTTRVHAYYGSCDGNGFDDGLRTYALTAEAIRPLLSGSNTYLGAAIRPVHELIMGD